MKKLLVALFLLGTSLLCNADIVTLPIPGAPGLSVTVGTGVNALPLQNIANNPSAVNITQGDDSYTNVPLGFTFPFFGQNFTDSWAMTNGMVTFQNPEQSGIWGACCSGVNLTTETNPAWNYSIFAVHTDLYSWNPNSQYYLRENNAMTYGWYNVSQCCSNTGGNSFEIKITSSGTVDTRIAGAMVNWNAVTSGMSGDLTRGEYFQYYHGSGWNITNGTGVSWNTVGGFTGTDMCTVDPLSSPTCPGYAVAYLNQQCTISALYNPSCPGYSVAYFTQQCSADPLYNSQCPGYASAYFTQQCSLNPLYSVDCPGYASAYLTQQCNANPLYSTTCEGYESAYFNQQCSTNPLYNSRCPGYDQAYLTQQCSLNPLYSTTCTGYAGAYHNQQCSLNPLYANTCSGYEAAYLTQQCTANQLYSTSCPGYRQAYFDQQCSLNGLYNTTCPNYQEAYFAQQCSLNGLYSTRCPNYATAYATQQALLVSQPVTTTTTTTTEVASAAPVTTNDGSSSVAIAVVADPIVNQAVTTTATSASPAAAATATVPLVTTTSTATETKVAAAVETKTETKEEKKADASTSSVSTTTTASTSSTETKPAAPTARQEIQAKRVAAARAKAVEEGKNLAGNMGKVADMETQKQVQNVVIAAMGFTPGFDAYSTVVMRDVVGYKPFTVYANQTNVDNRRLGRGLYGPSDRLHNELVESQYNRGN